MFILQAAVEFNKEIYEKAKKYEEEYEMVLK